MSILKYLQFFIRLPIAYKYNLLSNCYSCFKIITII
nr:MAG TPA: hypothetical protein [Caudoviricetes sp.]